MRVCLPLGGIALLTYNNGEKMAMCLNSQETTPQPSVENMKASGQSSHSLTPEQVRVGTNQVMTYAERQAFWKKSGVGKLLGFNQW